VRLLDERVREGRRGGEMAVATRGRVACSQRAAAAQ
jgi:hypothetical protein